MSAGSGAPANTDKPARKFRRRWLWLMAPVAIVILSWLEPDGDDLFELCASQGQPVVYRSVVDGGYYDGAVDDCWGCWGYLENSDYRFIEFAVAKKRREYQPLNEPGVYRVSRIDAGSPRCDAELTAHYTKAAMTRELMARNDWCFQVERFDTRQARYGRYSEGIGIVTSSPITGSRISGSRTFWVDHDRDEVIAEYTNYSLSRYPFIRLSSFRSHKHCNTFIDALGSRGIDRRDIVQPDVETRE